MIIDMNMKDYVFLNDCLSKQFPEVKMKVNSSDPMLKKLGFSDDIPCTVELSASNEQLREILDFSIDLEADVYMSDNPEKDPMYPEYLKWEKVYNLLYVYADSNSLIQ